MEFWQGIEHQIVKKCLAMVCPPCQLDSGNGNACPALVSRQADKPEDRQDRNGAAVFRISRISLQKT
jgi:hypothetical protein